MPPSERILHRRSTEEAYSRRGRDPSLVGKTEIEHGAEVPRVADGEVPVAVVHQDVGLASLLRQALDPRHPLLELVLLVVVAESLAGALALRSPRLRVASVEAHH